MLIRGCAVRRDMHTQAPTRRRAAHESRAVLRDVLHR